MDKHQSIKKILLFGGTFCPPHVAHIKLAQVVQSYGHFDQVIFIPCKSPVLDKTTQVAAEHRVAMLRLALQSFATAHIDLCEIQRTSPSYTITTLAHFRQVYGPNVSITLLIGMDNFIQLPRWHQWEKILDKAHILVIERAQVKPILNATLQKLLQEHSATSSHHRDNSAFGTIEVLNAGEFDLSATKIRSTLYEAIANGQNTDHWISNDVRDYIVSHGLFRG